METIIGIPMGVLTSEWTKLRSVRSTYLSMLVAIVIAAAGGVFSASGRAQEWATMTLTQRADFDPVNLSYDGFAFSQLAFGVLGVLAISSEYATGLICTTFAAMPRRRTVLAAKTVVIGLVSLLVGEVFSFITFIAAQLVLRGKHLDASLGGHDVLRAVAGAGIYLCALALIGLGLGVVVRHSAGAISALFGLVFLLPLLATSVSGWSTIPEKWNLWAAGNALISTHQPTATEPSTIAGLGVCIGYVVVTLGAACLLISRRDA